MVSINLFLLSYQSSICVIQSPQPGQTDGLLVRRLQVTYQLVALVHKATACQGYHHQNGTHRQGCEHDRDEAHLEQQNTIMVSLFVHFLAKFIVTCRCNFIQRILPPARSQSWVDNVRASSATGFTWVIHQTWQRKLVYFIF